MSGVTIPTLPFSHVATAMSTSTDEGLPVYDNEKYGIQNHCSLDGADNQRRLISELQSYFHDLMKKQEEEADKYAFYSLRF
jgi:hypothetical protein